MHQNNKISVIIPTGNSMLNKNGGIISVIQSLVSQTLFKEIEILIIHNGTEEDYFLLKNSNLFGKHSNIKIFRKKGLNRPQSRNLGASKSNSVYLLFLDDDTIILNKNILENIYNLMLLGGYDYSFGAKRYWIKEESFSENKKEILKEICLSKYDKIHKLKYIPRGIERQNVNLEILSRTFILSFGFIKRSVFNLIGGLNEKFDSFDDDILTYQLFKNNNQGLSLIDYEVAHIEHGELLSIQESNQFLVLYLDFLNQEGACSYDTMKHLYSLDLKDTKNHLNKNVRGLHITGDFIDYQKSYGLDLQIIKKNISQQINQIGLKELGSYYHFFGKDAYSGVICLAESHISIHTWPELNFLTLDIYVCNMESNNTNKAYKLLDFFKNFYVPKQTKINYINR